MWSWSHLIISTSFPLILSFFADLREHNNGFLQIFFFSCSLYISNNSLVRLKAITEPNANYQTIKPLIMSTYFYTHNLCCKKPTTTTPTPKTQNPTNVDMAAAATALGSVAPAKVSSRRRPLAQLSSSDLPRPLKNAAADSSIFHNSVADGVVL